MEEEKQNDERKTTQFEFSFTPDEFDLLLLMAGVATGATMRQGDKEMAYGFLRFVNRLNENNPNFTPYEIPCDAELEANGR